MGQGSTGPLQRTLMQTFTEHSSRLNQAIPADGSEPLDVPFPLAVFTVATLPAATAWQGGTVLVTDGGPGGLPVLGFSNGTDWSFSGTGDGDIVGDNNLDDLGDAATAFDNIKQAASATYAGVLEIATAAEVRAAATGDKALVAEHLETAADPVALTDAATVAVDWTAGVTFELTLTTDRILGNPTNEVPGTYRTVYVDSDGGPDALTFGSEYGGDPPTLIDISTTKTYVLTIYCVAAGHFIVGAVDGSPP